jgi:hypothetical protein
MSRDLKNPQQPTARAAGDASDACSAAEIAEGSGAPRLKYTAPRLKRLGSVRDLTLGSPPGKGADGAGAKKTM